MVKNVDLVILGGGTGGYVAAIRAAQQGRHVTLIEKGKLGGTCLHLGCIPTKAFLKSAKVMDTLKEIEDFGVENSQAATINLAKVIERKQGIVDQLHAGVQSLMKKNKIDVIEGTGVVQGPSIFTPDSGGVAVLFNDPEIEEEIYVPQNLIIATGSRPTPLPGLAFDEEQILSSDGMLRLEELPESLAIIGGGVIGCEWATIMNSFGVKVTLIEAQDRLLVSESRRASKALTKQFKAKGINVMTGVSVQEVKTDSDQIEVVLEGHETIQVDKVMISIGRQPNVDGIGLNNTNIKFDKKGIQVNEHYQTAEPHIYAIGDVIDTLQLAHVAMKEGELAVEHMNTGHSEPIEYHNVPRVTYTQPEVASVGYHKETLPEGMKVKSGFFAMAGNGKALIEGGADDGFVEVYRDEATDDMVGVTIVGPHASDLISELSTAIYLNASPLELGEAIHAHPTISETIQEAALDTYKQAIHK